MLIKNLSVQPPKNQLIGHRGVCRHAPENTLASFKLAQEKGLNWVEFDVRLTKDGQLVIFHDQTLERTTNGQGPLNDYTLAELKALDAGSWFSPEFSKETIPSLIETIDYLKQLGLSANIEIKCEKDQDPALTKKLSFAVADCLNQYWPNPNTLPLVSSFDHSALFYYREKLPHNTQAPIGFLVDGIDNKVIEQVKNTPNSALHCSQEYTTPRHIHELVEEGLPILVYTLNDQALGLAYLKAGAFAIFTDDPDIF